MLDHESAAATSHPKILVAPISPQSAEEMAEAIARLARVVEQPCRPETVRAELSAIVEEATLGQPAPPRDSSGPARRPIGCPVAAS